MASQETSWPLILGAVLHQGPFWRGLYCDTWHTPAGVCGQVCWSLAGLITVCSRLLGTPKSNKCRTNVGSGPGPSGHCLLYIMNTRGVIPLPEPSTSTNSKNPLLDSRNRLAFANLVNSSDTSLVQSARRCTISISKLQAPRATDRCCN